MESAFDAICCCFPTLLLCVCNFAEQLTKSPIPNGLSLHGCVVALFPIQVSCMIASARVLLIDCNIYWFILRNVVGKIYSQNVSMAIIAWCKSKVSCLQGQLAKVGEGRILSLGQRHFCSWIAMSPNNESVLLLAYSRYQLHHASTWLLQPLLWM